MKVAVDNAKVLCKDPKAHNWWGFTVGGESSHREHIKQELLTEIAWNPMTVDLDDCHETVDNWTLRPESSGTPSARNQGGYGYAILMLQHGHD